jgi:hypothetical protein
LPRPALDCNPPIYTSHIARITEIHNTMPGLFVDMVGRGGGLANFLLGLSSNHNLPDLCLLLKLMGVRHSAWLPSLILICYSVRKDNSVFPFGFNTWWVSWASKTSLPKLQLILVMPLGWLRCKTETKLIGLLGSPDEGLFVCATYSIEVWGNLVNRYLFMSTSQIFVSLF